MVVTSRRCRHDPRVCVAELLSRMGFRIADPYLEANVSAVVETTDPGRCRIQGRSRSALEEFVAWHQLENSCRFFRT
jgi:hypothetical protein